MVLEKAKNAQDNANACVANAQGKIDKAQDNFYHLCEIAKREKTEGNTRTRNEANDNATFARKKRDAEEKKLDIARARLTETKEARCKVLQQALLAQAACDQALLSLQKALGDFEEKTSKLLNVRACTRTISFGVCPQELLLAIFDMLEKNPKVKALVAECMKAYRTYEQFMKEFLLTLQHYICYRYSLDPDSAKGFCWEMGVGLFLFENSDNEILETFGTHLTDKAEDAFREVDATTKNCIFECKHLSWKRIDFTKNNNRTKKLKRQFEAHARIAKEAQKQYVVISREPIREKVAQWFTSNSISYIDPVKNEGCIFIQKFNLLYTPRYCVDIAK